MPRSQVHWTPAKTLVTAVAGPKSWHPHSKCQHYPLALQQDVLGLMQCEDLTLTQGQCHVVIKRETLKFDTFMASSLISGLYNQVKDGSKAEGNSLEMPWCFQITLGCCLSCVHKCWQNLVNSFLCIIKSKPMYTMHFLDYFALDISAYPT